MRVQTAFNRMLRLPGASVIDVSFGPEGVIVTVRLRRRRRVCSGCGQLGGSIHGRRVKRWRHLDLGANRCVIECELRRLWCRDCGVRYEAVPWSRADAPYTRDFEDLVAWLAQQMAKTPIAAWVRIGWESVGKSVQRVVAGHREGRRLAGLVGIGVDEISWRRGQRYLTSVADHRKGRIVWCAPGRNAQTLQAFFSGGGTAREHAEYPLADVRLKAPVLHPPSVRDFNVFEEHAKQARDLRGQDLPPEWYERPAFYFSNPAAIHGPNDEIPYPAGTQELDYELEVAAVIGPAGAIGGFTLRADVILRGADQMSVRDVPAKDSRQGSLGSEYSGARYWVRDDSGAPGRERKDRCGRRYTPLPANLAGNPCFL